jgi:hypothetical protein
MQALSYIGLLFSRHKEGPMTDKYVYYFLRSCGRGEQRALSTRRATLEAIKGMGEPVMESQRVVDHTEVDDHGFLIGGLSAGAGEVDELLSEIRSLERRAKSRDAEAQDLDESTAGVRKYMLSLESRELRVQAAKLQKQRTELMASEMDERCGNPGFAQFGGALTAE